MKIGFYYHIPASFSNGKLKTSGFLGVFLDSMLDNVDFAYFFFHEANSNERMNCDYELKNQNYQFVNLGPKPPAWQRSFMPSKTLRKIQPFVQIIDKFLVRSPSPLAPYFNQIVNQEKLHYLVVGDYGIGAKQKRKGSVRDRMVKLYLLYNDRSFKKILRKSKVIVNSAELYQQLSGKTFTLHQTRTTTLSKDDFFYREDTCNNATIKILYTGRIDLSKGLLELIEAFAKISSKNEALECHIVGWEENGDLKTTNLLKEKAKTLGVQTKLIFHGKKKVGTELNEMYRMADIYVLPSYHEGFPRTIWEAMANSLPVISTSVGSIPHYLKKDFHAILIDPKSTNQLFDAILELISNSDLRRKLIKNGHSIASENTLEKRTLELIQIIQNG